MSTIHTEATLLKSKAASEASGYYIDLNAYVYFTRLYVLSSSSAEINFVFIISWAIK